MPIQIEDPPINIYEFEQIHNPNIILQHALWLLVPKFVGQICYLEGCSLHILGLPLHFVEKWKQFDDAFYPKMTILKLALCVGSLTAGAVDVISQMPVNAYLNGNIFFLVHKHYESEMMQKTLDTIFLTNTKTMKVHTPIHRKEENRLLSYLNYFRSCHVLLMCLASVTLHRTKNFITLLITKNPWKKPW